MWRRHKPKPRRIRVYFDLKVPISQNVYFTKMTEDKKIKGELGHLSAEGIKDLE